MDKSQYDKGKGKVKLRAKIEIKDPKTLVIRDICYGTTTESLIRSIDEAAKKGKIKIEAINDYTARDVEIEIKLPRGQYAEEMLDALYGFTECEVSLTSQIIVIKEGLPWETDVHEILRYNAEKLVEFLKRELQIERDRLHEKIFYKSLERIFIEKRLYKKIETVKTLEGIHQTLEESFKPYHKNLLCKPTHDDREKLLQIPIRRISRFDIDKNQEEITLLQETLQGVEKDLKNVKKYTIHYLRKLIEKFGKNYPRKTRVKAIEEIDRRAIETKQIKVGFNPDSGFIGTKVSGPIQLECTNFDKLLIFYKDGTYIVTNIPEKQYIQNVAWVGIADKKTIMNVVYKNTETRQAWAKRFVVDKFILDKPYHYLDENTELQYLSADPDPTVELHFTPTPRQKVKKLLYSLKQVLVKGAQARGIRMATQEVKKVTAQKGTKSEQMSLF
jgi:topoisomerase-4 subunit A